MIQGIVHCTPTRLVLLGREKRHAELRSSGHCCSAGSPAQARSPEAWLCLCKPCNATCLLSFSMNLYAEPETGAAAANCRSQLLQVPPNGSASCASWSTICRVLGNKRELHASSLCVSQTNGLGWVPSFLNWRKRRWGNTRHAYFPTRAHRCTWRPCLGICIVAVLLSPESQSTCRV